ncbi:MAG: PAS domain-containing protein [Alphaproteobacteria bacterium]|nr:PAS domain-containing protein [Alphaproteobacteria bacterium]
MREFAPASVIVNGRFDVLHIHGRTGKYLEPASGDASLNIVSMAREGLQLELSAGLRRVFHTGQEFQRKEVLVKGNGSEHLIDLTIKPIREPSFPQDLAMVIFQEVATPDAVMPLPSDVPAVSDEHRQITALEHELQSTKEHLQTIIEELETLNEELQSSNEELQSTNEELQSTNEEHETAKEELQSINEELVTVNGEMEGKVQELAKINNDMNNLLVSTDIGTIFLDLKLCISRFTPSVCKIVNLIDSDMGRPLSHIVTNLNYPDLFADLKKVLDTLNKKEVESRAKSGKWYLIRILPYRTIENVIDGVVITFVDITDRKRLEAESRLATVLRDSNDAITVLDFSGNILSWNLGAEILYGLSQAEALGSNISEVVPEEQREALSQLIEKVRSGERIPAQKVIRRSRDGKELTIWLTASLLKDETGANYAVATTERDITWLGEKINL